MKSKRRPSHIIIYVLLVLIVLGGLGTKTLYDAGELGPIFHHPLPDCKIYKNITGAEDLTTVDEGRTVLLSVTDRQDISETKVAPGIYRYVGEGEPRLLQAIEGEPHGIASFPSEGGSRVYLIVHKKDEDDSVHIYDWSNAQQTLTLAKKIAFKSVRSLNGITALSGDRFFASQDLKMAPGFFQEIEKALRLPLGKVWFYDGESAAPSVAREDILYPNGLAVSPDEKTLYLASMTGKSLIVYDLAFTAAKRAELKWQGEWPLKTAPDNLKWDEDSLLIGTHRKLITLLLHSHDAKRFRAPSQLIRVKGLPEKAEIEELYATSGGGVEAVASGVVLKNSQKHIIMGGIWSVGMLDCAEPKN